ncbi:MAG: hypothetical protein B6D77_11795 [gamma proteobacterium symbiont of Ctena orbiculata]|nr:MAG: hypothetical protein B6D77_11795 [gamma proteobacterium symbiont of Ctena orbiculata]PVV23032.1 MAG: hypothetical protein B6D78_03940 [gamma proteobacterium symbiont of Ctena orbiculata]
MKFEISDELVHKAKIPHDIFLSNLIGNHILWFVAALGLVRSYWQPLALVPIFSFAALFYTLWRAKRSKDPWYVWVHWQIAAERSRLFIYMLLAVLTVWFLGWVGFTYFEMKKVAVLALIGGVGILPIMVTVLILILMESDALHQASSRRLSRRVADKYPYPEDVVVLEYDTEEAVPVEVEEEAKS